MEKERLGTSCEPEEWINEALNMPKLRLIPLSQNLAYRSTKLPKPIHGDSADQIIAATAREENAALLTRDKNIQNDKHVRTLWYER